MWKKKKSKEKKRVQRTTENHWAPGRSRELSWELWKACISCWHIPAPGTQMQQLLPRLDFDIPNTGLSPAFQGLSRTKARKSFLSGWLWRKTCHFPLLGSNVWRDLKPGGRLLRWRFIAIYRAQCYSAWQVCPADLRKELSPPRLHSLLWGMMPAI